MNSTKILKDVQQVFNSHFPLEKQDNGKFLNYFHEVSISLINRKKGNFPMYCRKI